MNYYISDLHFFCNSQVDDGIGINYDNRPLSCPQMVRVEHEEYVGVQSVDSREIGEQDGADLLERILSRDNLSRAYKRVRANHGAPGIDGMTIDEALLWLREHLIFGILSCILYNNAKYIVCWR